MRTLVFLLMASLAVASSAFPSSAAAQRGGDPIVELAQAAQNLQQWVSRVRGARLDRVASQFTEAVHHASHNPALVTQSYAALRQSIHQVSITDSGFLDAWDEVVVAYRRYERRSGQHVGHGHPGVVVQQPPVVFAPPQQAGAYFEGSFDGMPVRFSAPTPDAVYQQCLQFASAQRFSHVDDIVVHGRAYHNGPSFWRDDALCSIAALNSGNNQAIVRGDAEGTPFAVAGPPHEAQRLLQTYLPRALSSNVDDLEINGQRYHNQASFWNANEVVQMIVSQIAVPTRGAPRVRRARGTR